VSKGVANYSVFGPAITQVEGRRFHIRSTTYSPTCPRAQRLRNAKANDRNQQGFPKSRDTQANIVKSGYSEYMG
jgi:hypothetical protein